MLYNQSEVLISEIASRYIDRMYIINASYLQVEHGIIYLLDEDYEILEILS